MERERGSPRDGRWGGRSHDLRDALEESQRRHIAIGYFNFSDLVTLQAVATAAQELAVPVVVSVSEGRA